jgi:hypothetical protein
MSAAGTKLVYGFEPRMSAYAVEQSIGQFCVTVSNCLDYRLAVKHTKPRLLSVFDDCWRIISSERNRGGLPSDVCYGDFVVAWAGIGVGFVAFVFSGQ